MGRATILEFGSSQDGVDGVGGAGALLARRQRRPALQGVRRVRRRVPDLPPQLRRRDLQQLQSLFPAKCTGRGKTKLHTLPGEKGFDVKDPSRNNFRAATL